MFQWSKDDLSVIVLHSIAGLATQILITQNTNINEKNCLILDCGDGTIRDLLSLSISFNFQDLNGVIFSHGHYDHMGGLHAMLGILRMLGRTTPFECIYPDGSQEIISIIQNFQTLYQDQIPYEIIEVKQSINQKKKVSTLINELEIESFPVKHHSSTFAYGTGQSVPALGYKIRSKLSNTTIAYSGDTGPLDSLYDLFNHVDLALVEATHQDKTWIHDLELRYHLTVEEAKMFTSNSKDRFLLHKLPEKIIKKAKQTN